MPITMSPDYYDHIGVVALCSEMSANLKANRKEIPPEKLTSITDWMDISEVKPEIMKSTTNAALTLIEAQLRKHALVIQDTQDVIKFLDDTAESHRTLAEKAQTVQQLVVALSAVLLDALGPLTGAQIRQDTTHASEEVDELLWRTSVEFLEGVSPRTVNSLKPAITNVVELREYTPYNLMEMKKFDADCLREVRLGLFALQPHVFLKGDSVEIWPLSYILREETLAVLAENQNKAISSMATIGQLESISESELDAADVPIRQIQDIIKGLQSVGKSLRKNY